MPANIIDNNNKITIIQKRLTILVTYCNEAGHMNACIGTTKTLLRRGHRVIFLIHKAWTNTDTLTRLGYELYLYSGEELKPNQSPADAVAEKLEQFQIISPHIDTKNKLINIVRYFREGPYMEHKLKSLNNALEVAIKKFDPDGIIVDDHSVPPAVFYSGKPWIKNISMAPLFEMFDPTLPPGGSGLYFLFKLNLNYISYHQGLPSNGDRSEWPAYNEIRRKLFFSSEFNDCIERWGYQRYSNDAIFPPTQLLTIYACPQELNYSQIVQNTNWFNLESFNKIDVAAGESQGVKELRQLLSESFFSLTRFNDGQKWSGKWILVSMGSMGSVDLTLMKRLVMLLGQTNHKYVVSKGPRHDQYQLSSSGNMWGEKFLSQTALLPHMDLVITHGGNNSVTETFAQGKPMIVMPLFADQYDNAQRLHETGLGVRVDPYTVTQTELDAIIDRLLGDQVLASKLTAAFHRIQASDAHERLADRIECLLD